MASDNPPQRGGVPEPLPNPVVTETGAITFPKGENGELLRDHGFVMARTWAPCPGGIEYQCVVKPGQLMLAFLCRPEQLMVVGCPAHVIAFAAERGATKRRRHANFLKSGLLVQDERLLGPDGSPLQ